MNINAAFPSTYLKASDLQGRRVTIGIDRVAIEDVGGEHKPVLYFLGRDRGLVLNKTNGSIIAEMYGPETDDWHGRSITLYPARVEYQGKIVDAIRVHLVAPAAAGVADPHNGQDRTAQAEERPAQRMTAAARPATPRSVPVGGAAAAQQSRVVDDEIPF